MPFCVVEKNVAGLLPTGTLSIKLLRKVPKKHRHHVGVGVGLRECAPDLAFRVQGRQQGDPRRNLLNCDSPRSVGGDPCPADEAGLIEPRLVDVDDASPRVKER